jgi:hypothetical protein
MSNLNMSAKELWPIVDDIVRRGSEAPRIGKIRNFRGKWEAIIGDTVDRLLNKPRYSKELPAALEKWPTDPAPLVKLVTRAACASRKALLAATAPANPSPVDPADLEKMTPYTGSALATEPTHMLAKDEDAELREESISEVPESDAPSDLTPIDGGFRTSLTYEAPTQPDVADGFGRFSYADGDSADSANDRGSGVGSNREALLGSRWGVDKKWFSSDLLVTGGTGWNRFDDPAAITERQDYAAKSYSERELRELLGAADAAGINVRRLIGEAARRQAKAIERKMQAQQARVEREAELFRRESKTYRALQFIAREAGIGPTSLDELLSKALRKPRARRAA